MQVIRICGIGGEIGRKCRETLVCHSKLGKFDQEIAEEE
jgi:hypothetical protein